MSFFNDVYGDRDLSARTKTVCLYLHDRANSEGESWYAIAPSRRTWVSPAPQSNALLTTWSGWAEWKSSPVTGRTAARPPTCTDYGNESRRKNSLPTKGRLRQLTGPGAGSLRPTQKVPEEGLLSSENRNTFLS